MTYVAIQHPTLLCMTADCELLMRNHVNSLAVGETIVLLNVLA